MGRSNEGKPTRVVLGLKPLYRGSDGAHRTKRMERRESSLGMKNHFKPTKKIFIPSVIPRKQKITQQPGLKLPYGPMSSSAKLAHNGLFAANFRQNDTNSLG